MTCIDVFISSADTKETIQKRISPHFPDGRRKADLIDHWAESLGKQKIILDWGSYCYIVNKSEILDCLSKTYRNKPSHNNAVRKLQWPGSHEFDDLVSFCSKLSEDATYAIVW